MSNKFSQFIYNKIHYLRQRDPVHEAAFFIPIIYCILVSKLGWDLMQDPPLNKFAYFYTFMANLLVGGSCLVTAFCGFWLSWSWPRQHLITYYFRGVLMAYIYGKLLKDLNINYEEFLKIFIEIFPLYYFAGGLWGDNLKELFYESSAAERKEMLVKTTNIF